jgi:hypothetical protein
MYGWINLNYKIGLNNELDPVAVFPFEVYRQVPKCYMIETQLQEGFASSCGLVKVRSVPCGIAKLSHCQCLWW